MGPLRSALAAARRQRRRRGVFVSLYRPCCGAAAAIARRCRQGLANPPPRPLASLPPPNMVGLWRRWRQRPARSATPFSFLCLYPRGRLLARLIFGPRPALCPPPLPRRVALTEAGPLEARFPRLPRSGVLNPLPPARCRFPEPCGCRVPTAAPRTAHLPSPPAPGTYPAAECLSSSWGAL